MTPGISTSSHGPVSISEEEVSFAPQVLPHGGNRQWAATVAGCTSDDLLDFSASLNPLGPPSTVKQALLDAIQSPHPLALATYPDPYSIQLRHALSNYYHIDPDWILVGNGAAELMTWAARTSATCQTTYLTVPAFRDYRRALDAMGVVPVVCPLPDPIQATQADWSLASHLTALTPGSRALWLTNPHNPTGHVWSREEILGILPSFDFIVLDEAFMDFLEPASVADPVGSLMPYLEHYPQLVILRSLTKFFTLPGIRLGFAVGHPDYLRQWQAWRDPWTVNGLATVAGVAALQDQPFRARTLAWLGPAREHLREGLSELPGVTPLPSAVNFILAHVTGSAVALQYQLLRSAHILIRDCRSFPQLGDRYIRLAVRTQADHRALIRACHQCLVGGVTLSECSGSVSSRGQ